MTTNKEPRKFEGGRIYQHAVTNDGRGIKGKWECGNCGCQKNTFDTVLKVVDVTCTRCGDDAVLRVEEHLQARKGG